MDISVIELHRAAAHFPIGLLLSSAFFDLLGAVTRRGHFRETAYWTHLLGVAAAGVTLALGLLGNPFAGTDGDFAVAAARHQWAGVAGLAVFALLAAWRIWRRNDFRGWPGAAYAAATILGVAAVALTGHLGARIMG
jgi:uncharacterized membrane protein